MSFFSFLLIVLINSSFIFPCFPFYDINYFKHAYFTVSDCLYLVYKIQVLLLLLFSLLFHVSALCHGSLFVISDFRLIFQVVFDLRKSCAT